MIPKVIHYCWFGGKRKPKLIRDCISSWKEYLPEYEIIEWNEKNSDLSHPFIKEAYHAKKWAFVADYIRLQKLYEFGGIYLDTDMLVIRSFDELLSTKCFFGAEDSEFISAGIIGSIPNYKLIKSCLDYYNNLHFRNHIDLGMITIPRIITKIFRQEYNFYNDFDIIIKLESLTIYPPQYFYPFPLNKKDDLKNFKKYIKNDTYTIHLWNSSWMYIEYSEFHYFRNGQYISGFLKMIKHIYNNRELKYTYLRKIASCIKESL
jgi:mannosyltransferase OCH1-like enzyme